MVDPYLLKGRGIQVPRFLTTNLKQQLRDVSK